MADDTPPTIMFTSPQEQEAKAQTPVLAPVKNATTKEELRTNQAITTGLGGTRPAFDYTIISNSLTPQRLQNIIASMKQGLPTSNLDYLTLAEEMEEFYPTYRNVLMLRKLAAVSRPKVVKPASADEKDIEIASMVQHELVDTADFGSFLFDAMDAIAKGYSVIEVLWDTLNPKLWKPKSYTYKSPKWFYYASEDAKTLFMYNEAYMPVPLDPYKFMVFESKTKSGVINRGGLAMVIMRQFLLQGYTINDWMSFLDKFGFPIVMAKYGSDATKDDVDTLRKATAAVGTSAGAILPQSMDIEIKETKYDGAAGKFEEMLRFVDRLTTQVVLGQTMTTDDGSSLSQAKVHNDVRLEVAKYDAQQLANTINNTIIKWFVDYNFGVQQSYPRLVFDFTDDVPLEQWIALAQLAMQSGVPIPTEVFYDKLGIRPPTDIEPTVSAPPQTPARAHLHTLALATHQGTVSNNPADAQIDTPDQLDAQAQFSQELAIVLAELIDEAGTTEKFMEMLDSGVLYERLQVVGLTDSLTMAQFKAAVDGTVDFATIVED